MNLQCNEADNEGEMEYLGRNNVPQICCERNMREKLANLTTVYYILGSVVCTFIDQCKKKNEQG